MLIKASYLVLPGAGVAWPQQHSAYPILFLLTLASVLQDRLIAWSQPSPWEAAVVGDSKV